jgi:hypothetical protein
VDELATLKSMGLELPSPAYIVGAIAFGLVGVWAWYSGRRQQRPRRKWLGVALMFYPYLVWQTWLLYGVGAALCASLYFDRD